MYVQIQMYLLFFNKVTTLYSLFQKTFFQPIYIFAVLNMFLSKTSPKYIFVKFKFYVRNASQLLFVLINGLKKNILYDMYNTKYERNNFYKV